MLYNDCPNCNALIRIDGDMAFTDNDCTRLYADEITCPDCNFIFTDYRLA